MTLTITLGRVKHYYPQKGKGKGMKRKELMKSERERLERKEIMVPKGKRKGMEIMVPKGKGKMSNNDPKGKSAIGWKERKGK